ncbi:helix-turn-helix transcriptional regulator [Streptococcus vestibularis]|uniref:helix-turn-helix transcriptional regulator n=1 Tax=Streptococcus vestibularis TaxID=1343 RepID=UPI00232E63C1|nr:MerR family transcriptional regulator [Streptococcus vestibularis]MDB6217698.1 MerR family transcriptional regulator [Streptococcus vestibularis]
MNPEKINHIETMLTLLVTLIQQQTKQRGIFGIVTQKELLALLDISPNTLKSWEKKGLPRLEPPIEGTRTVYYKLSDILNFLEN